MEACDLNITIIESEESISRTGGGRGEETFWDASLTAAPVESLQVMEELSREPEDLRVTRAEEGSFL